LILRKFTEDFLSDVPILTTEAVVWHNRVADEALPCPWVLTGEVIDDLLLLGLDEDLYNENSDRRFLTMVTGKPENLTIIILVRGIDGASVHILSWLGLQSMYRKLNIVLAFTCAEVYVRFRAPEDHDFFYRTEPYDERLYCFFPLVGLINHVNGTVPSGKYAWLIKEWEEATHWRQLFSVAYQSGVQAQVNDVMADYVKQHFRPRNGLPLMRGV